MLCYFHVYSKVIQLYTHAHMYTYIYTLLQILFPLGYFKIVSRVPCAIQ